MNLTQRDFAEVRANVLARIEKRQRQRAWTMVAGVAFAMLALVFVLVPHRTNDHAVPRVARTSVRVPLPVAAITPPRPEAPTEVRATRETFATPVRHAPVHRVRHHQHHDLSPTPPPVEMASAEPLTIELQTSDPNIRIIWIARQENATP